MIKINQIVYEGKVVEGWGGGDGFVGEDPIEKIAEKIKSFAESDKEISITISWKE